MKFTPMEWLCATLSVVGRTGRSAHDDGAFKIIKQDVNSATVLHKETGAVWKFTTEVIREPIG